MKKINPDLKRLFQDYAQVVTSLRNRFNHRKADALCHAISDSVKVIRSEWNKKGFKPCSTKAQEYLYLNLLANTQDPKASIGKVLRGPRSIFSFHSHKPNQDELPFSKESISRVSSTKLKQSKVFRDTLKKCQDAKAKKTSANESTTASHA